MSETINERMQEGLALAEAFLSTPRINFRDLKP